MTMLRFRRSLACRQVVALLTDYLEDALSKGERNRLERHLAGCPHCREYLEQLRVTIRAAGEIDADEIDDETANELVAMYRRWRADIDAG
ncbi:zf-HC2 domain-containing protein [Desertimonas flava]|jgi:anti-sigma factor RsiW|uniref:zf-HC2 domain-containing protein n=1 Tax=Desertimonas flava TaxID=2064846 RepID=UPI000E34E94A|nr:zf-HC2 domain-containing protein [Desertimonas flava]